MGTVAGVDRLLADLSRIEQLSADLRPAWPELAKMWAEREARVFAGGAGWAPFSSRTLVDHAKTHKPPMVKTGALVGAMTTPEPRFSDPDMTVLGPPKSAKEASAVGSRHVRGTAFMPARKLVPRLTAAERRRMVDAIAKHVTKGL